VFYFYKKGQKHTYRAFLPCYLFSGSGGFHTSILSFRYIIAWFLHFVKGCFEKAADGHGLFLPRATHGMKWFGDGV